MSNRYLFRGKRKDTGDWVEGSLVRLLRNGDHFIFTGGSLINQYFEVFSDTVGMWTGLTIDDKKLFQGDIIELDTTDMGGDKVKCLIVFNNDQCIGHLGWGVVVYTHEGCQGFRQTDFLGKIKILSNKWDSPELLK